MFAKGDIRYGNFRLYDGRDDVHYALVVRVFGAYGVAIVGTSQHVDEARHDRSQLVLDPADVPTRVWESTGLSKSTRFDFRGGRIVTLGETDTRYHSELVGTVVADPAWLATFNRMTVLSDERIRRLIQAR
ncbi:MAG TPA: hypothetical protein VF292_02815 [Rhodanobacteraceae bacterium]